MHGSKYGATQFMEQVINTENYMVHRASRGEVERIVALVNSAYRPLAHERGWTHEADLVSGQRISTKQVLSLLSRRSSILTLKNGSEIVACVHVKPTKCAAEIGMLAVAPQHQARGLGKRMLDGAEKFAFDNFGTAAFRIVVLSPRMELIDFYERRGYRRTGQTMDYPSSAGFGEPLMKGLRVEVLVKQTDVRGSNELSC